MAKLRYKHATHIWRDQITWRRTNGSILYQSYCGLWISEHPDYGSSWEHWLSATCNGCVQLYVERYG